MEGQWQSYSVLPDNWIRVIELQPGQPSDPIHVQLEERPLANDAPYEALSYHWGDAKNNLQRIFRNGKEFVVTANLHSALKRLRKDTESRTLWVDAICINQGSNREMTQQICIMTEIYSGAEGVLIWLGEHPEDSALEYTIQVADARRDYAVHNGTIRAPPDNQILALFHPDPYYHQVISSARRRLAPPEIEAFGQSFDRESLGITFVGIGAHMTDEYAICVIYPDFDRTHVERIARNIRSTHRSINAFNQFL